MNSRIIKRILRIFILLLLLTIIIIKIAKYKIISFKSPFYNNFNNIITKNDNNIYNISNEIKLIDNFLNNRITVVNIYDYNSIDFLKSLRLSKYIIKNFDDVGVFDIVIKNGHSNLEDIIASTDNKIEFLIKNYGIRQPILYINESELNGQLGLDKMNNKLLILDELGNVKYVLNNDIDTADLKAKIKEISRQKKYFSIKKTGNIRLSQNDDSNFIGAPSRIILIEDKKNNYPELAILDTNTKRILITSINGEIIYDISSKNFCLPSSIKYIDKKLYVSDMCDNSIKLINLENQQIETLLNDYKLFGITDFELLDDKHIIFSTATADGIKIYNKNSGDVEILTEKLKLSYRIGKVNKITKKGGKIYYLDYTNNILYMFDGEQNSVVVDLNESEIALYSEIKDFYINTPNNIYFFDTENSRILHKIKDKIQEDKFLNFLKKPKDMLIFKNIIYLLDERKIKEINLYDNRNRDLPLNFSKNRKIFFNVEENIDIHSIEGGNIQTLEIDNDEFLLNNLLQNIEITPYSPSFLAIFEKNNSKEIILNKILFYNNLINMEKIHLSEEKEYVLYGKIYHDTDEGTEIKNIDEILLRKKH